MVLKLPQVEIRKPGYKQGLVDPDHIRRDFARRDEEFRRADDENLKKSRDVELQPGVRFILRSPNGTRYSVLVDNAGVISTVAI
jgi:hypothetical protein